MDFTATILDIAGLPTESAVDWRSLLPLVARGTTRSGGDIVCEFHGHHFPYPQRMLRTTTTSWSSIPSPSTNCTTCNDDPDELINLIEDPRLVGIRRE